MKLSHQIITSIIKYSQIISANDHDNTQVKMVYRLLLLSSLVFLAVVQLVKADEAAGIFVSGFRNILAKTQGKDLNNTTHMFCD